MLDDAAAFRPKNRIVRSEAFYCMFFVAFIPYGVLIALLALPAPRQDRDDDREASDADRGEELTALASEDQGIVAQAGHGASSDHIGVSPDAR